MTATRAWRLLQWRAGVHDGRGFVSAAAMLLLALAAMADNAAAAVPTVAAASISGAPGQEVTVAITYDAAGGAVAGVQNDIIFDPATPIVRCSINPDLGKNYSQTSIHDGWMRAIIFGFDPSPIADGVTLYTCTVAIVTDAAPGTYPLQVANTHASTAIGSAVPLDGISGSVVVLDAAPVSTATPLPTATASPTIPPGAVIAIGADPIAGEAGTSVTVAVHIDNQGLPLIGVENTIDSDALVFDGDAARHADCVVVSQGIVTADAAFVLEPAGCIAGVTCTGVLAEVRSPNGLPYGPAQLYRCTARVRADAAPAEYPLTVAAIAATDRVGHRLPLEGTDGRVTVLSSSGAPPEIPVAGGNVAASGPGVATASEGSGCRMQAAAPLRGTLGFLQWLLPIAIGLCRRMRVLPR